MPDGVELPAPVNTTARCAERIRVAALMISRWLVDGDNLFIILWQYVLGYRICQALELLGGDTANMLGNHGHVGYRSLKG